MTLDKITIHWTAGSNKMCQADYEHYHYMIDGNGTVFNGKFKPEDNINCNDGKYAAHCGGGNTGNIGVAICGMYGFKDKNNLGKYPITAIQLERAFKLVSDISKRYKIPIDKEHIFTHYEFGKRNPKTSSAGKIDIIYLPPYPNVKQDEVGDFIRNKVKWYFNK